MKLADQKKGTLLAFTAIMFITPDSLLIRLSNVESWNLIFYRGSSEKTVPNESKMKHPPVGRKSLSGCVETIPLK